MVHQVFYLGGNGHCAARLLPARAALAHLVAARKIEPFELVDIPCPGFEGRPRAPDLEAFLSALAGFVTRTGREARSLVYATGIGGLLALCLRARGEWLRLPLVLQAPVLWGLEHRLMPRVLRLRLARFFLARLLASRLFQARFVRKQFEKTLPPELRVAFFEGYAHCSALADFFTWLTPVLLRQLETDFAARPEALQQIAVWWGGRDRVVDLRELAWTEQALQAHWPVHTYPHWGHYPMIDAPEDWVRALSHVLAEPQELSRPHGPETE